MASGVGTKFVTKPNNSRAESNVSSLIYFPEEKSEGFLKSNR